MDVIRDILIYQTQMMRNLTLEPYSPPEFTPSPHIIAVNALFYASLGIMLLAAFIAMLIKSWVREFDRGLSRMSIPEQRAKTREFRNQGMLFWKLPEMVALLPFFIQISLLLFSIGLVIFLFNVNPHSCGIMTAILGIDVLFYALTTSIAIISTSSPFRSPLSRSLGALYQRIHGSLYPTLEVFFSTKMDTAPRTRFQTWRRQMQTFLRGSRPYPEKEFVKLISDAPEDTTQLRISTAALEWLHNTAPSSEHSEHTHWSVWFAARTPPFFVLPSLQMPRWIDLRVDDPDYLARHSVEDLRALYSVLLPCNRSHYLQHRNLYDRLRASDAPWDKVLVEIDRLLYFDHNYPYESGRAAADIIVDTIKSNMIRPPELLWLVEILSDDRLRLLHREWFIDICVAVMWIQDGDLQDRGVRPVSRDPRKAILVDATITFAALVFEIGQAMVTQRRQYPWLLPRLRNQTHFAQMVAAAHGSRNQSFTFSTNLFLFLVVVYLIRQDSTILAREYMDTIVRDDGFLSWTAILAATAPIMAYAETWAMTRLLMVERRDRSHIPLKRSSRRWVASHQDVLKRYDASLEETEEPEPYLLVTLLHHDTGTMRYQILPSLSPFRSPWWNLAIRAMFSFETPVGDNWLPDTSRSAKVLNIVAAKCLIHAMRKDREPGLEILAIFLQSREFIVASLSLKYFSEKVIGNTSHGSDKSTFPEPPQYFKNAVQVTFTPRLLGHQLLQGWSLVAYFTSKWELLPSQWRKTFADAFFAHARRETPRQRVTTLDNYPLDDLKALISWEYITEWGVGPGMFNGMEWFLALWPYAARKDDPDYGPDSVDPSTFLHALGELIAAATDEVLAPLLARIREFALGIPLAGDDISAAQERLMTQIDRKSFGPGGRVRTSHRGDWSFCALYFD